MCFSPEADLVGGIIVGGIGVDACRHLRGRNDHLLLASLPLVLGFHQLDEAFVWWGLEGNVPHGLGRVALWIYISIAFVVLPMLVPVAVVVLEPTRARRWRLIPFVLLGAGVSTVLLTAMLRGPIGAAIRPYHLYYSLRLTDGAWIVVLYIAAVCGALLFSGYRHVMIYGFANFLAVAILAQLTMDGFASLWCGYAAISAAAIALHMRYTKPHPHLHPHSVAGHPDLIVDRS